MQIVNVIDNLHKPYGGQAPQKRRAVSVYGWTEVERAAAEAFGA